MSRMSFRVNSHSIVSLNVKELLAQRRRHSHLASLAKWFSVRLRTKWLWIRIMLLSLKLQIWRLLSARSSLTFKQIIECGFTLKLVQNIIITHCQMHRTDEYSQHSSIVWLVWLNGWVFVYKLSGCGFKSRCCHLNFRKNVSLWNAF